MPGSLPRIFIGIWLQHLYSPAIIHVKDTGDLFFMAALVGTFHFLLIMTILSHLTLSLKYSSPLVFTLTLPLQPLLYISVFGSALHQPSRHYSAVFY